MSTLTENMSFAELRVRAGFSIPELVEELGYTERTLYRWECGKTAPKKVVLDFLRNRADKRQSTANGNFTFIDLFAGIGGLRHGFDEIGGRCVFTSEWNKYAQATYMANYPCTTHEVAGDITQIEVDDIPVHDVLLAGFPCQPFSIAGVSKKNSLGRLHGFRCDAQGTLFFDVARIIEAHQPRAFLLENVKNLMSHDKGKTFAVIYKTLTEELGYQVSWKVIDAKSFVPQHRERIFIVGFRDPNEFTFDNMELPSAMHGPRLGTILHPEDGSEHAEGHFTTGTEGKVSDKYTLTDNLWQYLQNYAAKHKAAGNGFGFGLNGPDDVARTLSARYYKDGSEILIRQEGKNPRRLTPRECARLMGFDGPGESAFRIPVSDTQAYKQFGNSVVVPVVDAVAQHMAPFIRQAGEAEARRQEVVSEEASRELALASA